jgi:hypothetical protein
LTDLLSEFPVVADAAAYALHKFALFPSMLFTIGVHSELFPTLAGVHPAGFSMSLSILYTCCTTEAASRYVHEDMTFRFQRC